MLLSGLQNLTNSLTKSHPVWVVRFSDPFFSLVLAVKKPDCFVFFLFFFSYHCLSEAEERLTHTGLKHEKKMNMYTSCRPHYYFPEIFLWQEKNSWRAGIVLRIPFQVLSQVPPVNQAQVITDSDTVNKLHATQWVTLKKTKWFILIENQTAVSLTGPSLWNLKKKT